MNRKIYKSSGYFVGLYPLITHLNWRLKDAVANCFRTTKEE
jgi:hypothetical protein